MTLTDVTALTLTADTIGDVCAAVTLPDGYGIAESWSGRGYYLDDGSNFAGYVNGMTVPEIEELAAAVAGKHERRAAECAELLRRNPRAFYGNDGD